MRRTSVGVALVVLIAATATLVVTPSAQAASSSERRPAQQYVTADQMSRAELFERAIVEGAFEPAATSTDGAGSGEQVASASAGFSVGASLAEPDDDIPGVYIPPFPVIGTVHVVDDPHDVFCYFAEWEESVVADLSVPVGDLAYLHFIPAWASSVTGWVPDWGSFAPHQSFSIVRPDYYYFDVVPSGYVGEPARSMSYTLDVKYHSPDDQIPGIGSEYLVEKPTLVDWYDSYCTGDDVYRFHLFPGDRITARLTQDADYVTPDFDLDLFVYGPEATDVTVDPFLVASEGPDGNECVTYTASAEGDYYLDAWAVSGGGLATLSWEIARADVTTVYRFFNRNNGSHFYTPSAAERDTVIARWSNTYAYEGVAYSTATRLNDTPLYRFYNRNNGSHFYTPNIEEVSSVLAKWPHIFSLEGTTYSVCTTIRNGGTPVYRFFNVANGSHFYTISVEECNNVIQRWPDVYQFEGVTFWVMK